MGRNDGLKPLSARDICSIIKEGAKAKAYSIRLGDRFEIKFSKEDRPVLEKSSESKPEEIQEQITLEDLKEEGPLKDPDIEMAIKQIEDENRMISDPEGWEDSLIDGEVFSGTEEEGDEARGT